MKNIIFSDIECYMKGTDKKKGDNTYKISENIPIAIGSILNGEYCSYFGSNCIKDFVKEFIRNKNKALY